MASCFHNLHSGWHHLMNHPSLENIIWKQVLRGCWLGSKSINWLDWWGTQCWPAVITALPSLGESVVAFLAGHVMLHSSCVCASLLYDLADHQVFTPKTRLHSAYPFLPSSSVLWEQYRLALRIINSVASSMVANLSPYFRTWKVTKDLRGCLSSLWWAMPFPPSPFHIFRQIRDSRSSGTQVEKSLSLFPFGRLSGTF